MRKELRYIIEKHKYKTDVSEYLIFILDLIFEAIIVIIGLALLMSDEILLVGIGLILAPLIVIKIYYSFKRFGQLNKFELIYTDLDSETCYKKLQELSKSFETKKIDWYPKEYQIIFEINDPNWPIKLFSHPAYSYWITVVIQDNYILVNERPTIFNLLFWIKRNQIKKIKKLIKTAANNGEHP